MKDNSTDSTTWSAGTMIFTGCRCRTSHLHVCRHTYCSNMAKSGMNPKTLQYLMGHSDISMTMNVYTHIGFDDAEEELRRLEELRKAQDEVEKKNDANVVSQKMFKVV